MGVPGPEKHVDRELTDDDYELMAVPEDPDTARYLQ